MTTIHARQLQQYTQDNYNNTHGQPTTITQDNYNNTHGQPTTITQDNLKLATIHTIQITILQHVHKVKTPKQER